MLTALTIFHVLLSLVGIGAGFIVVYGLLMSKQYERSTSVFLNTTLATSLTGFLFPFHGLLPSHIFGVLSFNRPELAIAARRHFLAGAWRKTYVISSIVALYLNVFILIVQMFRKVPALHALAPTESEAPFQVAQLAALVFFVALGIRATMKFRDQPLRAA